MLSFFYVHIRKQLSRQSKYFFIYVAIKSITFYLSLFPMEEVWIIYPTFNMCTCVSTPRAVQGIVVLLVDGGGHIPVTQL